MNTNTTPKTGILVLAFAAIYLVWGSTYLAIRFVVESIPPFFAAGTRFLVAGAILYLLSSRSVSVRPTARQWLMTAIIGTLLLLGGNGMVTWAEQTVTSGQAALLVATEPLWVAILDWLLFRGPRPTLMVVTGLAFGLLGVFSLVGSSAVGDAPVHWPGALALTVACACWAGGSLLGRDARLPDSPFLTTSMQMLCGGGALLLASGLLGEWSRINVGAMSTKSLLSWVYLCVMGSLVGLTAYVWLVRVCSAAAVSTYAFVNPLVAVIVGSLIGGELLSSRIFLASGLIGTAVLLVIFSKRRTPHPKQEPNDVAKRIADPVDQVLRVTCRKPATDCGAS